MIFENNNNVCLDAKWIDWRMDGDLLLCACTGDLKIYDKREGKIVKVFEKIHGSGMGEWYVSPS